jgi:hypothetical protein
MMNLKELERKGPWLIKVLSWHLLGAIEESHENLTQDSLCPGRDSSRVLLEYKSER